MVFLSAGHSLTDPGAVANGRREADIAREFRNMVELYLRRDGIEVSIDGKDDSDNWPLSKAAQEAKRHKVAVEFHCNSTDSESATGCETLSGPDDMRLGASLSAAAAAALNLRDRGAKPENSGQHSRLAFVRAGGIILEILFIPNASDLAAYDARKWLAAKAVAGVIREQVQ